MPPSVKKTTGGTAYTLPWVGRVDHTIHVQVDLTKRSTSEIDAQGFIKPGVVLPSHGGELGSSAGTQQVETATVAGTIGAGGAGNVSVTVTAKDLPNGSKVFPVAVANNDTASTVATKIRPVLSADAEVSVLYTVGGAGADVVLTAKTTGMNDATLNIATATGTATGLTAAPTSANTTAGVGPDEAVMVYAATKVTDSNVNLNTNFDRPFVTCAVIAMANRYIVENNLGRSMNATEITALRNSRISLRS